ncbi:MAG: ATP-binding protein [bacterium]|nr:ATP-binding protein [bacterium]
METKPRKICFVGAPSTGKSTLAKLLTEELIKNNYSVEFVGEFARDFIIEHGAINSPQDQLSIHRVQREKEKLACSRNPEFVVCDTPSFLSHIYFDFLKDKIPDKNQTEELNKSEKEIRQEINNEINSYEFVFFLSPEFPTQKDGIRLYTDDVEEISNRMRGFLSFHNVKHHELKGTVKDRAGKALKIILS